MSASEQTAAPIGVLPKATREQAMDRFVTQGNIRRFNRLLAGTSDDQQRQLINRLLDEEMRKLAVREPETDNLSPDRYR